MSDNIKNTRGMSNCIFPVDELAYFSTTAAVIVDNQKEDVDLSSLNSIVFVRIDGLEERVYSESLTKSVYAIQGKVVYGEGKGGRYWFSDSDPIALDNLADLIAYSLIMEGKESKTILVPVQGFDEPQFKEIEIKKHECSKVIEIPKLSFNEATEIYNARANGYCIMKGSYPELNISEGKVTLTLGSELCVDEILAVYWLAKYKIEKTSDKINVLMDVEDFIEALENACLIYSDKGELRTRFNCSTVVSKNIHNAFTALVDKTHKKD